MNFSGLSNAQCFMICCPKRSPNIIKSNIIKDRQWLDLWNAQGEK